MNKYILMISAALLFGACTKQGGTGPQGPQGNANVKMATYTGMFSLVSTGVYQAPISIPSIANDATCIVMVYLLPNASQAIALPVTSAYETGDQLYFTYGTGEVDIDYQEGSTAYTPTSMVFNIAVIPTSVINAHPNTNWKNLSEVSQLAGVQISQNRQ